MAKLNKSAQAGTLESSDMLVSIAPAPAGKGIKIDLSSAVMKQYGEHIKNLIINIIKEYGIEDATIHATDKGAIDWIIEARVKTAITRAMAL